MDTISKVGVIDKSVAVLDALAVRGPLTLADLVSVTGMPRPTAHRIAVALLDHGLVGRDEDGRFRLGLRLAAWGTRAAAPGRVIEAAPRVLARLRDATGESAQLYVADGDHRVCVAAAERPTGLRDTVAIGARLPLAAGSGGTVLRVWAPAGQVGVVPENGRGRTTLETVRRRGWAESVAEREVGVASVSAPVLDPSGDAVAAISVSGPIERLGDHPGDELAAPVLDAARALERDSGLI